MTSPGKLLGSFSSEKLSFIAANTRNQTWTLVTYSGKSLPWRHGQLSLKGWRRTAGEMVLKPLEGHWKHWKFLLCFASKAIEPKAAVAAILDGWSGNGGGSWLGWWGDSAANSPFTPPNFGSRAVLFLKDGK